MDGWTAQKSAERSGMKCISISAFVILFFLLLLIIVLDGEHVQVKGEDQKQPGHKAIFT